MKVMEEQLERIEKRLKQLLKIVVLQSVLLAVLLLSYLVPNLFLYLRVAIVLAALAGVIYVFRNQIPGWLGNVSRLMFAMFEDTQRKT